MPWDQIGGGAIVTGLVHILKPAFGLQDNQARWLTGILGVVVMLLSQISQAGSFQVSDLGGYLINLVVVLGSSQTFWSLFARPLEKMTAQKAAAAIPTQSNNTSAAA